MLQLIEKRANPCILKPDRIKYDKMDKKYKRIGANNKLRIDVAVFSLNRKTRRKCSMNQWNRIRGIAAVMAFVVFTGTTALAVSYTDVPTTHWAYSSVSSLAKQGIMVGDSMGNYNPDQAVDKFYMSKVLAKLAGYKYISATATEMQIFNQAYEANKTILQQYNNAFSKWDSTADKEISYLMKKGILTMNDLNQYAIRLSDGTEKLRALTREEYCVFLVRLMGKTKEAEGKIPSDLFTDDTAITLSCRPYVYYLRDLGVISGDASNQFTPRGAVTKATMAVMTDKANEKWKTFQQQNQTGDQIVNPVIPPVNPANDSNVTSINSISGTVYKIYDSLNAVQITVSGTVNTYKLSEKANLYIDGAIAPLSSLKEGMTVNGVVSNSEMVELRAQSLSTTTGNSGTNVPNTNPVTPPITNPSVSNPASLTRVEGTVISLERNALSEIIQIRVPSISAKGMVTYTDEKYAVDANCKITRNGQTTNMADIQINEVIYAGVSGATVHTIELEQREVVISEGSLIKKYYDSSTNQIVLTITDDNGKENDYVVTKDSIISRKGLGGCKWSDLRIGDKIEMTAEYSSIIALYARGELSTESGWVSEIMISNDGSSIKVRDTSSEGSTYRIYSVADGQIDLYHITLDSKVKLKLDSNEVIDITVLSEGNSKSSARTGFILTAKRKYIEITDKIGDSEYETIYLDSDTRIVDGVIGRQVDEDYLDEDMEIYLTLRTEGKNLYAKTITIIDYND